jgi:hypothetical protein
MRRFFAVLTSHACSLVRTKKDHASLLIGDDGIDKVQTS